MGMQGQSSLLALWGRQLRVQSQHSEAQRDAEEEREMPEGESREGEDPTTSGAIRGGQACTSEVSGCSPSESAAPRAERCLTRNKGEAPVVSTAAKEGSPNIRQNTQGGGSGHAKKRQRKDQPATSQMTLTYCFASAPQCHGLAPVEQTGGACPASMDPTPLSDSDLHMTDKDASTRQRILRAAEQPAGSSVQERVHPEAPATENGAVSAEMGDPVGDQSGGTPNAEASGRVSSSAAAASPGARFTQRMNQATTSGCSTMWCPPPAFCPALSTMPRSLVPAQRGSRQGMGHSMRGPSKPRPATEHSRKSLSRQLHLDLGQVYSLT